MDPRVKYLYDIFLEREIIVADDVLKIFDSQSTSDLSMETEFVLLQVCLKK